MSNNDKFNETINNLTDTPDTTEEYDDVDIAQNKIYAVLSYIGILFVVPLFAAKDSRFAKFHCNQGFVLFIFETVWSVFFGIMKAMPFIHFVMSIIGALGGLVFFIFMVLGIVNAATGKAKELPVIGGISIIK